jgi:two-component system NtrC family sensor kinase
MGRPDRVRKRVSGGGTSKRSTRQRRLKGPLVGEIPERERNIELRAAQKLESLGRLAAGIAHEINTPVQFIGDSVSFLQTAQADLHRLLTMYRTAFQQLAQSDCSQEMLARLEETEQRLDPAFLSTEIPRAFQRTLEGVERVAAIVRAMKEFAHPDSIEQSPADLNHAVETTLLVAHNEYKYNAQVESRLGELPQVMCNIGELHQVLLNLIVNAAHAIAESGKDVETGRITITTQASGDSAVICVEDNGCGISKENLEKIFDPLFTTKPAGRGTGQGLAITRTIITEKHGGTVDVHSAVGSGTRFVLRLPIAGRSPPAATNPSLLRQEADE